MSVDKLDEDDPCVGHLSTRFDTVCNIDKKESGTREDTVPSWQISDAVQKTFVPSERHRLSAQEIIGGISKYTDKPGETFSQ
jgi:hypothetical protein